MLSKRWRERAIYAAMSAFVAWHSFAILVAPAPDSAAKLALRPLLHPYLTLLGLDNPWDFYAPNIDTGYQFRYLVESADGASRTFVPVEEVSWYRPNFWWIRQWQDAIVDAPDVNADLAGALLCQQHAALHPAAVTLMKAAQKDFSPDDYLHGKQPLDPDFVNETIVKRVACAPQ